MRALCPGPLPRTSSVHPHSSQGSGELLDRAELAQAEAEVESGRFDLVVVEDLGRVCRRNRAIAFCELCEDACTRLVAINDALDTTDENWRLNAFFASLKHESGNKDTSMRIRRTLRNRFEHGGIVQTFPYGYIKAPDAKSDADVCKDPNAEAVYETWFTMLEAGASYAEVADYLNAERVPTGRWARGDQWDGRMVARITHNPILKGFRRRNERMSQRVNKTGRRRSVKAPTDQRLMRHAPHLQFIDPVRYDRMIALLAARHDACARGRKAGSPDMRSGVAKKSTVWPGQHVLCRICGRLFYWGGHGQAHHMMCAGARDYSCWNAATFDGYEAGRELAAAVLEAAESLPEFDDVFRAKVTAQVSARRTIRAKALDHINRELKKVDNEIRNLLDALAQFGPSPSVQGRLKEAEYKKANLDSERENLLRQTDDVPVLPSVDTLKKRARAEVGRLAFADPSFGRLMTTLMPKLEVYPYQALDGGAVVLRAHAEMNLAPLTNGVHALGQLLTWSVVIDLFDPPQRIAFRVRVVALRQSGLTEGATANELGITVTAAQRAMALHRQMVAAGTTDPYVLLTAPPAEDGKIRRHRHPRYRFAPLDGYPHLPRGAT